MSRVKLNLLPPPNDDFVQGYPGIPSSGPNRPQATVTGAVEFRTGPHGINAKWLSIELRKVETLPGGGLSGTFYDSVGPSPINLWTSLDEYNLLQTQDFPFSIRIPESVPPSVELGNRSGIQYELVASVCIEGERGFLRIKKPVIVSSRATIIIDKHELHSTWPIYHQPESRQVVQDEYTLIVDRDQTCYGPGDRITVTALFGSGMLVKALVRGFELTLMESKVFHARLEAGKKSAAPQAIVSTISESRSALNTTLYAGAQHRTELTCNVPPTHTTPSLTYARHLDITYVLCVKMIVNLAPPVVMDLPVILSNWPRGVSEQAMRRIGPIPTLSLLSIPAIEQRRDQWFYEVKTGRFKRVQGGVASAWTPHTTPTPPPRPAAPPPKELSWITVEDEKSPLSNRAQAVGRKARGFDYSPPASLHGRSDSDGASSVKKPNKAAEMYSQAMSELNQGVAKQRLANTLPQKSPFNIPASRYLTVEQEKAAHRRYQEVMKAVHPFQNAVVDAQNLPVSDSPPSPDPENKGAVSSPPPYSVGNLTPTLEMPPNLIPSQRTEEETLRRPHEELEAGVSNGFPQLFSPFPLASTSGTQGVPTTGISYKIEADDAQALSTTTGSAISPQPPSWDNSTTSTVSDTQPSSSSDHSPQPSSASSTSPGTTLTSAQETASLRAQFPPPEPSIPSVDMAQQIDALVAMLEAVFANREKYKQLLACRDSSAQKLLDMFQHLLDVLESSRSNFRRDLIVATQRLAGRSGLYPSCYELGDITSVGYYPASSGAFADIYEGTLQGKAVCLKTIRLDMKTEIQHFLKVCSREAILWGQLSHPNILPFYGVYRFRRRVSLVSPWMDQGDINTYLRNNPSADRIRLVFNVAEGLQFLHENGIIHGDLKGPNILIDQSGIACLADFGISSISDSKILAWTSHSSVASKGGSVRWQAPELFDPEGDEDMHNTVASDVYAWSCVAYEIFAGHVPFEHLSRDTAVSIKVRLGERPARPPAGSPSWIAWGLTETIWSLMEECWKSNPVERPAVNQIIEQLLAVQPKLTRITRSGLPGPRDMQKNGHVEDSGSNHDDEVDEQGNALTPARFREMARKGLIDEETDLSVDAFERLLHSG